MIALFNISNTLTFHIKGLRPSTHRSGTTVAASPFDVFVITTIVHVASDPWSLGCCFMFYWN